MPPAKKFFLSRLLFALIGGVFCALLSYFKLIYLLDTVAYALINEATPLPPSDDILIIAIDDRSLLELGRWPWPRERHIELLRQLNQAGVKAAAIDIVFAEFDNQYPETDQLLSDTVAANGNIVLPVFIGLADRGGQLLEFGPIKPLADSAAGLGHVHIEVDNDGVARSLYLREGLASAYWEHFSLVLARQLLVAPDPLPGAKNISAEEPQGTVAIARSNKVLLPFMGPAGTVEAISFVDVLRGRVPERILRNKIVFVGVTAAGHVDNISTSLGQISGVEINANIFQALRHNALTQPLGELPSALLSFALFSLALMAITKLHPRYLLLASLGCVLALPLMSALLYLKASLWFSPAALMLSLLIAYPLWNWLRLETLVSFVNQQLTRLIEENRNTDFHWSWAEIERAARLLKTLGTISSWQLNNNSPSALGEHSEGWEIFPNAVRRTFFHNGESRELTLEMSKGQTFSATQLNLVFPDNLAMQPIASLTGDPIENNLRQLEGAYLQARHGRTLISNLLAQLSSGVILADTSGRVLLLNQQARNLLALQQPECQLFEALERIEFTTDTDIQQSIKELILDSIRFFHEGVTLDGNRNLFVRGRLIHLDQPAVLVDITDVTDLKASETRRLEALNFLSHDLRAPLSSVLALIEGARTEHPDQINLQLLENIEHYIQNNLDYAENYTQVARLDFARQSEFSECEAQSLIDNAASMIYHAASGRNIHLDLQLSDEDIWINCNRTVLERAIINLLDNALKYSFDNSTVTVSLLSTYNKAIIQVIDQGSGMSKEECERIFNAYQQGSNIRSGVGLGLYFVSGAVKLHNGTVSVKSQPGMGSEFTLTLPKMPDRSKGN